MLALPRADVRTEYRYAECVADGEICCKLVGRALRQTASRGVIACHGSSITAVALVYTCWSCCYIVATTVSRLKFVLCPIGTELQDTAVLYLLNQTERQKGKETKGLQQCSSTAVTRRMYSSTV